MEIITSLKNIKNILIICLVLGIIALFMSIVKNVVTERWLKQKNTVACVPADTEYSFPIVYHQTAAHPVQNDAILKSFVEEYIRLTQNEQIIDYHRVTQHERYNNAQLSQSKFKAIQMSTNEERALNMKRYAESNETFTTLKKGNMGWIFLIDDILIKSIPESGVAYAVVRGEFQATYDKVEVDIPHHLWGYHEIQLTIYQGIPTKNSKDEDLNPFGLYVGWSFSQPLTSNQKDELSKRNKDFYLLEQGE